MPFNIQKRFIFFYNTKESTNLEKKTNEYIIPPFQLF
jgi:hypothetical protein